MHAFDYRRPGTVNEADLALKAAPGAKLLAGGQTLLPTLKQLPTVDRVVLRDRTGSTLDPDGPGDSTPACLEP